MTDWHLELKCRVPEEVLPAVKQRLEETLLEFATRPRFTTVEAWLVDATDELGHQHEPLRATGYEAEHRGRVTR